MADQQTPTPQKSDQERDSQRLATKTVLWLLLLGFVAVSGLLVWHRGIEPRFFPKLYIEDQKAMAARAKAEAQVDAPPRPPSPLDALKSDQDRQTKPLARLLASLKDPESAKVGPMYVFPGEEADKDYACGMVNAKNGFGGYNGPRRFIVLPESDSTSAVSVAFDDGTSKFGQPWMQLCVNTDLAVKVLS